MLDVLKKIKKYGFLAEPYIVMTKDEAEAYMAEMADCGKNDVKLDDETLEKAAGGFKCFGRYGGNHYGEWKKS